MHSNDQLFIITNDDFVIFEIRAHWGGVGGSIYIELCPNEHCHNQISSQADSINEDKLSAITSREHEKT